jgi:hypothetical protein
MGARTQEECPLSLRRDIKYYFEMDRFCLCLEDIATYQR